MKKLIMLTMMLFLTVAAYAKDIKLTSDNTVVLRNAFSSQSVTSLKQDLLKLNSKLKSGYPIYLVLYTPGGSIQAGLELFEFIKGLNRPVHTITIFAASMGFQAVQHLGKRYILKYGVLMSHNAAGGASGEFNGSSRGQLYSRLSLWSRRVGMMDRLTVKRTNGKQTLQSYQAAYSPELWLNGPEAVEQGYADEIATVSCDNTLTESTEDKEFTQMFFKVKATFSKCPLITAPVEMSASLLTNQGYMNVDDFLAQNGKFGKKCREVEQKVTTDYFNNKTETRSAELCAYDKTITYQSIMAEVENKQKFLNRDLKNYIERSY